MRVTLELTFEMSQSLGVRRLELEDAQTVEAALQLARARFQEAGADFEKLARVVAIAVNGVLLQHRKGPKQRLADGDRVSFVKAAAGG